jgi:hypothetical protein
MATNNIKDHPECSNGRVFLHEMIQSFSCWNYQWNCNPRALPPSSDENYPYFPVDEDIYDIHDLNEKLKCAMNIVDNACSMFSLEKINKSKYKMKKEMEFPSVIYVENESSCDRQSFEDRDYHSIKFIDENKNIQTSPTHMSTICSTESNYLGDDIDFGNDTNDFPHQDQDLDDTIDDCFLTRSLSSITNPSCFDSDDRLSYDSDDRDELQIILDDNDMISALESLSKEDKVCLDLSLSQSTHDNEMNKISRERSKDSLLSYDRFSQYDDENSLNDLISLMADSEVGEVLITNIYSDDVSSMEG